ncbi:hypothetical protein DRQ18_00635 [bacterium]|nr:MAG: hypothetical protein DRQ18_00635 [bacterium]
MENFAFLDFFFSMHTITESVSLQSGVRVAPAFNENILPQGCTRGEEGGEMKKSIWMLVFAILWTGGCDLVEESAEPGTIIWEYTFPDGAPNIADVPALYNGTIYATTAGSGCWLYAINSEDGTQIWCFHIESATWIGRPVVGEDGTIYVVADKLYAINPDGTEKWEREPEKGYVFTGEIALDRHGTIYAALEDHLNPVLPQIIAVAPDGTLKWAITYGDLTTHNGFLEIGPDGTLFLFAESGHAIYAFTASTGDTSWIYEMEDCVSGPAALDENGVIYVGLFNKAKLIALNGDGILLWERNFGAAPGSPVIAPDGTIYTKLLNDSIVALNPADGTVIWKEKIYEFDTAEFRTIVVDADGNVYIHGADSYGAQGYTDFIYALDRNGELLWKIPDKFSEWPPLIDSHNTLYVQTPSGITAIQAEAGPANSPWPRPYHDTRNTSHY